MKQPNAHWRQQSGLNGSTAMTADSVIGVTFTMTFVRIYFNCGVNAQSKTDLKYPYIYIQSE